MYEYPDLLTFVRQHFGRYVHKGSMPRVEHLASLIAAVVKDQLGNVLTWPECHGGNLSRPRVIDRAESVSTVGFFDQAT